jgi:hypothetical protein
MLTLALTMLAAAAEQPAIIDVEIAKTVATPEYRPLVAHYAQCIVERDHTEAADFVLRKNVEWTKSGQSKVRKLIDKSCVPSQATQVQAATLKKMTVEMLRSPIADALVRFELPTSDPTLIATAQPLPSAGLVESLWPSDACKKCNAEQRKEFDETRVRTSASMAPYIFAECAVRTDPGDAHKLLMSEMNSADESSAFAGLAPAFSQCVAEDAKINSSRTVLRGLIALSYYRLAHAPRVGAAAQEAAQ